MKSSRWSTTIKCHNKTTGTLFVIYQDRRILGTWSSLVRFETRGHGDVHEEDDNGYVQTRSA